MSSNPFDLAHEQYQSMSPFDFAEQQYSSQSQKNTESDGYMRNIGGGIARGLEGFLGTPGNIQNLPRNILEGISPGLGKVVDDPLEAAYQYAEQFEPIKNVVDIHRKMTSPFKGLLGKEKLPTTQDLRGITQELTGKSLEPKGELEEAYQETAEDIGSMLFPVGGQAISIGKKIALPILGNLTKAGLKFIGANEGSQEIGKAGVQLISSLINPKGALRHSQQLLNNAEKEVGNMSMSTEIINRMLNKIERTPWYRAGPSASTAPAFRMFEKLKNASVSGKMDMPLSTELRKQFNEELARIGAFSIGEIGDKRKAVSTLNQVKNSLLTGQRHFGRTQKKGWWKKYQDANRSYAITKKGGAIADFIEKQYKKPFSSELMRVLFHSAIDSGVGGGLGKIAGGAAALSGVNALTRVGYRISNDPLIRKYYTNAILNASRGNAAAMSKNIDKLDKHLSESE